MKFQAQLIRRFLIMYFFILKAASEGWNVRYKGDNKFTFLKNKRSTIPYDTTNFINKYFSNL